jgi:gas vesicle protein
MCIGRFFTGFVIGSAVGGILGLLLAPRAGEETRDLLMDKSEDVYKTTEESIKELQNKANDVMDNIQTKGDELLNKVQELIRQQKGESN